MTTNSPPAATPRINISDGEGFTAHQAAYDAADHMDGCTQAEYLALKSVNADLLAALRTAHLNIMNAAERLGGDIHVLRDTGRTVPAWLEETYSRTISAREVARAAIAKAVR